MAAIEHSYPPANTTRSPGVSPVLEVTGLTKRFPGVTALDDVSLALLPGQVHGLIGQNGAGKSTLINILSGMYSADAGTIAVKNSPVEIASTHQALSLGISTVYQEHSLLLNLTVEQNLALGREPRRYGLLDLAALRNGSIGVLQRLGLRIDPRARVSNLSLAERQMVEIAKALSTNPSILILDEPTAPLGSREANQLFEAISWLKAQGVAVLYVSHRFAEVLDLCDTATVLRNGKCVLTTELSGWSEARLTEAMIGGQMQRYEASLRTPGKPLMRASRLSFGRTVQDVSFEIRSGEIVALTGLLGSGQNEIARLIGGDLRAQDGHVEIGGRRFTFASPHEAAEAGICLLTEDRKQEGILPNLSLRQNIAIASLNTRTSWAGVVSGGKEREATDQVARTYGIVAASQQVPVRTLSGGNQQKALLARWHLADASVFVLIEPTRGVDVGARAQIYGRLDALARAGKSLVIISSDLPEVLALADRIIIVREGRITCETSPQQVDEEKLNILIQGGQPA
ncbi:sugar ABC transporter ATP-binding protein [Mesorhizobium sp. BAC0120]|uniref:sugar ABC transporter ATP-binding protein n=1 Tax=Mesorhizobium sp. BAC0120 TaxID=3090670 RepID=UPI00298C3CD6|nr:sugar ABC transporter ATP-binding protein [Mesorhizobium sp. BAC0120]MDW6025341.1 sugar ABC transporter ATP-binding protein [Mesorhizobium sp. BAC0120]